MKNKEYRIKKYITIIKIINLIKVYLIQLYEIRLAFSNNNQIFVVILINNDEFFLIMILLFTFIICF